MQSVRKLLSAKGSSCAMVLAAIAISTVAGASSSQASLINNGSTFDLSIWGFTGRGGTGSSEMVVGPITGTFGGTNTYTSKVLGSTQVTTVTSSESLIGGTYTDSITISVPTNFDAADLMIGGQPLMGLFFDLGDAVEEAISGPVTQNGWMLNTAINPAYQSAFGSALTSSVGLVPIIPPPTTSFNGTDTQQYAYEGVEPLTPGDIAPYGVFSFTYTSSVPEPVSAGLLGTLAGVSLLRRRRRA